MTRKTLTQVLVASILGLWFAGCAATPQFKPDAYTPQGFGTDRYGAKVDAFIVVFDASSSMTQGIFNGKHKINIAKEFVHRMNQTIPPLKMQAGLRTFGQDESVGKGDTALVYGVTEYTASGLNGGLEAIQGYGGSTPISAGLLGAGKDLEAVRGPMAIILVSDGEEPSADPLEAEKALKQKYGDRLCIYTVAVGDDPKGLNRLKKIAETGGCGFFSNAEDLMPPAAMADFVKKVFLTERTATKPEPKPEPKPAAMAPMAPLATDGDGDGVPDDRDKCPGTPKGARVDDTGCWMMGRVNFDFDKSNIKPQNQATLNEIASVMKQNPTLRIGIHGHTDSKGTAEYNQGLSERRARSAKEYLIGKGINAARIDTVGQGFRQPIATNETDDGRAQNRRDEFTQTP